MYMFTVAVPDHKAAIHLSTRIVIGCYDQAQDVAAQLDAHGVDVTNLEEVATTPERSPEEMQRAQRLMALLFSPVVGSA